MHQRVGDDPQHARIVDGKYGTSVGYISEDRTVGFPHRDSWARAAYARR
jgi:hypothetical protein